MTYAQTLERGAHSRRAAVSGRLALAVVILAMCSCSSSGGLFSGMPEGRDFSTQFAEQIEDGVTTKDEVWARLGKPHVESRSGSYESWTYTFRVVRPSRIRTLGAGTVNQYRLQTKRAVLYGKTLLVLFDTYGVVTSHLLTESGQR